MPGRKLLAAGLDLRDILMRIFFPADHADWRRYFVDGLAKGQELMANGFNIQS